MSKSTKKVSITIGAIIIMIGIIAVGLLLRYGGQVSEAADKRFMGDRAVQAKELYDSITSHDLDKAYPDTPEKLMDLYNRISLLIYGDMIADEAVYGEMVTVMRKLYSDEILSIANNSEENQVQTILQSVEILKESNTYIVSVERGISYYPPDNANLCVIPVKQDVTKAQPMYWNYYLSFEDGLWKVGTWEQTDENYNPLGASE